MGWGLSVAGRPLFQMSGEQNYLLFVGDAAKSLALRANKPNGSEWETASVLDWRAPLLLCVSILLFCNRATVQQTEGDICYAFLGLFWLKLETLPKPLVGRGEYCKRNAESKGRSSSYFVPSGLFAFEPYLSQPV